MTTRSTSTFDSRIYSDRIARRDRDHCRVDRLVVAGRSELREAARRAQCTNNLKQLGLAALNYESGHGHFARRVVQFWDPFHKYYSANFSCFVHMLPYTEQQPMYNATNFNLTRYNVENITIAGVKVASLACPSDQDRFGPDPRRRRTRLELMDMTSFRPTRLTTQAFRATAATAERTSASTTSGSARRIRRRCYRR